MPTNTCPTCGRDPGDARAYCPRCGAKLKAAGRWKAVAAACAFLLACAWFFNFASTSPPSGQSRPAEQSRPAALLASPAPGRGSPNPANRSDRPSPPTAPASDPPPARRAETVADQAPSADDDEEVTVYVTRTGAKYHRGSCRYLRRSKIPMALEDARDQYDPCGVCDPPE